MVRSIIVLLLFLVFFLAGMVFGMERDNLAEQEAIDGSPEELTEPVGEEAKTIAEEVRKAESEHAVEKHAINVDQPVHFTQKTASFLEAWVKGFYETIVQIIYQLANLFF